VIALESDMLEKIDWVCHWNFHFKKHEKKDVIQAKIMQSKLNRYDFWWFILLCNILHNILYYTWRMCHFLVYFASLVGLIFNFRTWPRFVPGPWWDHLCLLAPEDGSSTCAISYPSSRKTNNIILVLHNVLPGPIRSTSEISDEHKKKTSSRNGNLEIATNRPNARPLPPTGGAHRPTRKPGVAHGGSSSPRPSLLVEGNWNGNAR